MTLEWRVPVQMREPVKVSQDMMPSAADVRSVLYENVGLIQQVNIRDLAGSMGKMVRIISIFAYIDNTLGAATDSWVNFNHVAGSGILGQAFLNFEFECPAAGFLVVHHYIGASTTRIYNDAALQEWHCALPDLLMDEQFRIDMVPNGGVGRYYILYEVYDK